MVSNSERSDYCKYAVTATDTYMYIARVKNTVIYASSDVENKEEIEQFIKAINY